MNRNSVVTPNIDLTKVEAINQKRTLAFINHWILHTVGFLNQFSAVCEERLVSLDTKLRRANHSLSILEAKLNSVPDLEGVVAPSLAATSTASSTDVPVASSDSTPSASTQSQTSAPVSSTAPTAPIEESSSKDKVDGQDKGPLGDAEASESPAIPVSKDPRFAQYFKMLAVGVPEPAVRMKMSSEGLDPSILDDPNAPAPSQPGEDEHLQSKNEDSDTSSVSSWSD